MDVLVNWLWQGALVTAATGLLLVCLRGAHARHRYAVCAVAWLTVLALPLIQMMASVLVTPTVVAVPWHPAEALGAAATGAVRWSWADAIAVAFALWITVGIVRAASAVKHIRRLVREASPLPSEVEGRLPLWANVRQRGRVARLALSAEVRSAGVLFQFAGRSALIAIAPEVVRQLSPAELDQVVLHEWAHVQRRDDLGSLVLIAGRAIAGWHPALWWLSRRLELEREVACDEMVVELTGAARPYASCLTSLAGRLVRHRTSAGVPAVLSGSVLAARVTRILRHQSRMSRPRSAAIAAMAIAGVCVVSARAAGVQLTRIERIEQRVEQIAVAGARPLVTPTAPAFEATSSPAPRRMPQATPAAPAPETAAPPPAAVPGPIAATTPEVTAETNQTVDRPSASERAPAIDTPSFSGVQTTWSPPPTTAVQLSPQPQPPPDRTLAPWTLAANGGVAIGHGSQKAAVATAGFFTRVAKSIAGSFKK